MNFHLLFQRQAEEGSSLGVERFFEVGTDEGVVSGYVQEANIPSCVADLVGGLEDRGRDIASVF